MPRLNPNGIELTGAQLRAARGLLGISAEVLANETKISLKTIRRAEQSDEIVPITRANSERIVSVLEARGVRFIYRENEIGVCLLLPRSEPRAAKAHAGRLRAVER